MLQNSGKCCNNILQTKLTSLNVLFCLTNFPKAKLVFCQKTTWKQGPEVLRAVSPLAPTLTRLTLTMSSLCGRPSSGMEPNTRASWLPCSAISVPSPVSSQCLEERSSAEMTWTAANKQTQWKVFIYLIHVTRRELTTCLFWQVSSLSTCPYCISHWMNYVDGYSLTSAGLQPGKLTSPRACRLFTAPTMTWWSTPRLLATSRLSTPSSTFSIRRRSVSSTPVSAMPAPC